MGGVGGTTAAGASGGDATEQLGGEAGMGVEPELPLPPGCEPRGRMETADTCSLAVYCDTASEISNCRRLPNSERWQCQCDLHHPGRTYQLENAPGLQACALAASLCFEDELDVGEETCTPSDQSSSDEGCALWLNCATPVKLDPQSEARAWLTRLGSASCWLAESGKSFACTCNYGDVTSDYDLLATSAELDCRPLVDFCMSGAEPDFGGEQQCLLMDASSTGDGCERYEGCAAPMPLTAEVSLARLDDRYSNCSPRVGGGSECYCSGDDSSFNFQLPDAPGDAACESSMRNCDEGVVIEATGDVSCQPSSMTAFADSCEADLSCLQDATVDARKIVAEGRLLVSCARVEAGMPWWCSCASDQQTAQFQLGAAELSPWQVCGQAPAGCLEHLDVHLGPYGEFVSPPYPLP